MYKDDAKERKKGRNKEDHGRKQGRYPYGT